MRTDRRIVRYSEPHHLCVDFLVVAIVGQHHRFRPCWPSILCAVRPLLFEPQRFDPTDVDPGLAVFGLTVDQAQVADDEPVEPEMGELADSLNHPPECFRLVPDKLAVNFLLALRLGPFFFVLAAACVRRR